MTSHAWGISITDSELSRRILMFNLVDIFLPIFTGHCVFAFIGKLKELKYYIISTYVVGVGLLMFFLANPSFFLLTSVPKMYFPNYYVAGPYYFVMLIFFFTLTIFTFYAMIKAYKTSNNIDKNRIKYFAVALLLAYGVGSIDFLLIYDIQADSLWASFFIPLFAIPFTYAALKYELMDIRLVAKRAFIYIVISAFIGFLLVFLNYINNLIIRSSPGFPDWISSAILALLTTIGLLLIWQKIREADFLKYEFVDIISHKFRTPLTAIKWFSERLFEAVPENLKGDVSGIQKSANSLINLTNLLANLSLTSGKSFAYNFVQLDLNNLIKKLISETSERIKAKNITIPSLPDSTNFVLADEAKIKFVFQTLLDNAINYSKQDGKVSIEISTLDEKDVVVKVTDSGIGIGEKEIKYIFTKFYRTDSSKKADTEGMGIGLFLSQRIVEKHDGKIWVKSEGLEKGSSFFVSLPILKK
jgi:signal transduction histidine kinase